MLGTQNRFAGLKIDDDDEERASKSKGASSNQNQSNAAAKKKSKKKAKEAEALRSMAFGSARGGQKHSKHPGSGGQQRTKPVTFGPDDWEEWQRRDTEATEDMFEKDLESALLASRQDAELNQQIKKQAAKDGGPAGDSSAGGKKKKKKDKPQAMSLDQFQQLPKETLPGSEDENEDPSPPPRLQMTVPVACQDKQYFESISSDANKILQKERIQEQYQKAYALESAMQSKYQEEIEQKDKYIKKLQSRYEKQTEELKDVKGRNARLCKILADGEMKEKKAILVQVEELTADKEHLTEQLALLTAELEKERTKNHTLQAENDKLKGKHAK
ncbi:hypothetical protein ACOMHN_004930 [Nucella lapillus]